MVNMGVMNSITLYMFRPLSYFYILIFLVFIFRETSVCLEKYLFRAHEKLNIVPNTLEDKTSFIHSIGVY